jgi:hypothetical protein
MLFLVSIRRIFSQKEDNVKLWGMQGHSRCPQAASWTALLQVGTLLDNGRERSSYITAVTE